MHVNDRLLVYVAWHMLPAPKPEIKLQGEAYKPLTSIISLLVYK